MPPAPMLFEQRAVTRTFDTPGFRGMSLYAKRLERGRFIWPQASDGAMVITPAQLSYMLEGIDWRNPIHTFRPQAAG